MQEIEKLQKDLRQSEKLEVVGNASARIAHDFNNILAMVMGNADLALREIPEGASLHETVSDIKAAAKNGRNVVEQILAFTKKTAVAKKPTRIDKIALDYERAMRRSLPDTVEVKLDIEENLAPVMADPTQMTQILMNLCQNALHAMGKTGGVLTISLSNLEVPDHDESLPAGIGPGRYVKLTVADNGCGMAPEVQDKIFDPYFTTKSVDEGTGLGLAIIYGTVKDHEGAISVDSNPGNGSVFDVYIPQSA